jgi:hypothetical protein
MEHPREEFYEAAKPAPAVPAAVGGTAGQAVKAEEKAKA